MMDDFKVLHLGASMHCYNDHALHSLHGMYKIDSKYEVCNCTIVHSIMIMDDASSIPYCSTIGL